MGKSRIGTGRAGAGELVKGSEVDEDSWSRPLGAGDVVRGFVVIGETDTSRSEEGGDMVPRRETQGL
jgi:hypothetical protein